LQKACLKADAVDPFQQVLATHLLLIKADSGFFMD